MSILTLIRRIIHNGQVHLPSNVYPKGEGHQCRCDRCRAFSLRQPIALCLPGRQHRYHIGVRFGDIGKGYIVKLDGIDVTENCVEAFVGVSGANQSWIVLQTVHPEDQFALGRTRTRCECGKGTCMQLFEGKVEVIGP